MTKINPNKVKNRMILTVVIVTAAVITLVFLANSVTSFVTAIQSSNKTPTESGIFGDKMPNIYGSINVLEKTKDAIKSDPRTSFV